MHVSNTSKRFRSREEHLQTRMMLVNAKYMRAYHLPTAMLSIILSFLKFTNMKGQLKQNALHSSVQFIVHCEISQK